MGQVTISGNPYDIYGTSAGANIYLAGKLGADAWEAATEANRNKALVTATRLIRTWLKTQKHDVDPAGSVDARIEQANYELADAITVNPTIAAAANSDGNEKRLKAGEAEVEYFRPTEGGRFPPAIQALLSDWLGEQGATTSLGGYGVNASACNESTLGPCDYGLSSGF